MSPLLSSLAILLLVLQVRACSKPGRFGPQCEFHCHCNQQCDRDTGRCPGSCDPPWSGPSCQRENVAYNKGATSSGTFEPNSRWSAARAVDGNRNQSVEGNSCYISNRFGVDNSMRTQEAWLTLDLGRSYRTRHMTVYGRDHDYSLQRLNNTRLSVSNSPNDTHSPCYTFTGSYSRGLNVVDLVCDGEGRYVTLYDDHIPPDDLDPSAFMEICEIEVYVCSPGRFGEDCEGESHFRNDSCSNVTGEDCQGCAAGFLGNTCSSPCQETEFGENCASTCHCLTPGCDPINGSCYEQGCLDGYDGDDCNSDVDECAEAACDEDAVCVNIPGSFYCVLRSDSTGCGQAPVELGAYIGGIAGLLLILDIILFSCYLHRRSCCRSQKTGGE